VALQRNETGELAIDIGAACPDWIIGGGEGGPHARSIGEAWVSPHSAESSRLL
jgi:protein gp37